MWLDVSTLEHGAIYRVASRNLVVAVFDERVKGFIGVREKFGSRYLFTEYDWSMGPPYGTARAMARLEGPQPFDVSEQSPALFEYLSVLDAAIQAELAAERERELVERERWSAAHPHTRSADELRGRIRLRRHLVRRYPDPAAAPAGLRRLLATSLSPGAVKNLRDQMRQQEKLAVREFTGVAEQPRQAASGGRDGDRRDDR